jgi:hypothetical protein
MTDVITQWVAVFVACGPFNICAIQNDPQPYYLKEECQATVVSAQEDTNKELQLPAGFTLAGMCLKINVGTKI